MKITNLNNIHPLPNSNKNAASKVEKREEKADSINISPEAREILEKERAEKLNEVKRKIGEGYYDRKQVLEKTAQAILKELKS